MENINHNDLLIEYCKHKIYANGLICVNDEIDAYYKENNNPKSIDITSVVLPLTITMGILKEKSIRPSSFRAYMKDGRNHYWLEKDPDYELKELNKKLYISQTDTNTSQIKTNKWFVLLTFSTFVLTVCNLYIAYRTFDVADKALQVQKLQHTKEQQEPNNKFVHKKPLDTLKISSVDTLQVK